ncbi:ParB N-terminal domain-containing protein [Nonomuraea angiospora]|uniref:hypothetical protein n=1 Tax=Nonomuraea angiospora TaxID=46172 RepID=UPI0029AF2AFE|nr:hypothetical protein [Nonomuraea angiospora]MDX3106005.1 hypothetical protein [Nonomuraea angiospora]
MPTFEAIAYRQNRDTDGLWLLTFVASAENILTWASIPRRAVQDLIGFQRGAEESRVAKAKEFFKRPNNFSPTSLIIGLHPREANSSLLRVEFLEDENSVPNPRCRIHVEDQFDRLPLQEIRELVRSQIQYRLSQDAELSSVGQDDDLPPLEASENEQIEDSSDDYSMLDEDLSAEQEDGEVELGTSILKQLLTRLDDDQWVDDHEEDLRELAKPATVIDGQHRVLGAAACENEITFAVTAILDCPWREQVFQFTVINYTAKGIPDQFITANAALSLTGYELETLQDRLVQAGVKVTEYELMRVVHFDARSPFFDKVNLTERPNPNRIGYKTMVRIAKSWYNARHPVFQLMLPNLYPQIRGKGTGGRRDRTLQWKRDDWGEFFLTFWRIVAETYRDEPSHERGYMLWDVGHSQLIVAIVLYKLQESFLDNLGNQDEEFFAVDTADPEEARKILLNKVERRARKFLESMPAQFFSTKWAWTGLNIGPGRDALEQALTQLARLKGKYQYAKSSLVTGKTDAS